MPSSERAGTPVGCKPSCTGEEVMKVCSMLGQQTAGIAQIAKETGLTRQTLYRSRMTLRLLWLLAQKL
jgi:DNA-binding IclR family transcriptional regulator